MEIEFGPTHRCWCNTPLAEDKIGDADHKYEDVVDVPAQWQKEYVHRNIHGYTECSRERTEEDEHEDVDLSEIQNED